MEKTTREWLKFWQEQSAGFVKNPEVTAKMTDLFQTMQQRYAAHYAEFSDQFQSKPSHDKDVTKASSSSRAAAARPAHDGDGRDELILRIAELESRIQRLESAFLEPSPRKPSKRKKKTA
jgi:hypothetical protein